MYSEDKNLAPINVARGFVFFVVVLTLMFTLMVCVAKGSTPTVTFFQESTTSGPSPEPEWESGPECIQTGAGPLYFQTVQYGPRQIIVISNINGNDKYMKPYAVGGCGADATVWDFSDESKGATKFVFSPNQTQIYAPKGGFGYVVIWSHGKVIATAVSVRDFE